MGPSAVQRPESTQPREALEEEEEVPTAIQVECQERAVKDMPEAIHPARVAATQVEEVAGQVL